MEALKRALRPSSSTLPWANSSISSSHWFTAINTDPKKTVSRPYFYSTLEKTPLPWWSQTWLHSRKTTIKPLVLSILPKAWETSAKNQPWLRPKTTTKIHPELWTSPKVQETSSKNDIHKLINLNIIAKEMFDYWIKWEYNNYGKLFKDPLEQEDICCTAASRLAVFRQLWSIQDVGPENPSKRCTDQARLDYLINFLDFISRYADRPRLNYSGRQAKRFFKKMHFSELCERSLGIIHQCIETLLGCQPGGI